MKEAFNTIQQIARENLRTDLPEFSIGDTLEVSMKIIEGTNQRIQAFVGIVIARKGVGVASTITLRRVISGQGVERVIPLNSPNLAKLVIKRHGVARRAKLYYLRDKVGKGARIKEKVVRK